jgi:hypothetical protein
LILLLSVNTLGKKVSLILDRFFKPDPPPKQKATATAPGILPKNSNTSNPITQEPDFNSMFAGPSNPQVSPMAAEPMPSNFGGFGNNMF